ncbi:hypothetical protein LTR85_000519 [Meristemomyces frigidus]|nr:hypothetical protein LTR85_000519 [Meristemomyces frigidus]
MNQHDTITSLAEQQKNLDTVMLADVEDFLLLDQYGVLQTHAWAHVSCTANHDGGTDASKHLSPTALQRLRTLAIDLSDFVIPGNDEPSDEQTATYTAEYLRLYGPHEDTANKLGDESKSTSEFYRSLCPSIQTLHFLSGCLDTPFGANMCRVFNIAGLTRLILQDCITTAPVLRALLSHGGLSLRTLVVISHVEKERSNDGSTMDGIFNELLQSFVGLRTLVYNMYCDSGSLSPPAMSAILGHASTLQTLMIDFPYTTGMFFNPLEVAQLSSQCTRLEQLALALPPKALDETILSAATGSAEELMKQSPFEACLVSVDAMSTTSFVLTLLR